MDRMTFMNAFGDVLDIEQYADGSLRISITPHGALMSTDGDLVDYLDFYIAPAEAAELAECIGRGLAGRHG